MLDRHSTNGAIPSALEVLLKGAGPGHRHHNDHESLCQDVVMSPTSYNIPEKVADRPKEQRQNLGVLLPLGFSESETYQQPLSLWIWKKSFLNRAGLIYHGPSLWRRCYLESTPPKPAHQSVFRILYSHLEHVESSILCHFFLHFCL